MPVQDVARALSRAGIVTPPFLAGDARLFNSPWAGRAATPELVYSLRVLHPSLYRSFDVLDDALALLDRPTGAMVQVTVVDQHFRRSPENRYGDTAAFGFYRVPEGYPLVIGELEDWQRDLAKLGPTAPPTFEGTVTEWLWVEGKSAPHLDDFLGSPLHECVAIAWPEALVFGETRL
jgi:hypothetical protein